MSVIELSWTAKQVLDLYRSYQNWVCWIFLHILAMMMMDRWKMRYCDDEQSKIGFLFISLKLLKKRNHLESFYVPCNPRGKWSRIPLINHHQRLQAAHYSGWWSPNPAHLCCWEPHQQRLQQHLTTQHGGLPCLYPPVEIRRMEGGQRQDGGAWGRTEEEDSQQIFLPSRKGKFRHQNCLNCSFSCLFLSVVLDTALRAKALAWWINFRFSSLFLQSRSSRPPSFNQLAH